MILLPCQLLQVEKRLAVENEPIISFSTSSPLTSFGSPLHIFPPKPQTNPFKPSSLEESSDTASEFLSIPSPMVYDVAPPLETEEGLNKQEEEDEVEEEEEEDDDDDDEIDRLISLLGLSAEGEKEEDNGLGSCHCSEGGFYRRTVGVKGPVCVKEIGRLNGWIEHYRRGRKEPARLAHLLLAKAVSLATRGGGDDDDSNDDDDDDGFRGISFPATVEEFLERDPPFEKVE